MKNLYNSKKRWSYSMWGTIKVGVCVDFFNTKKWVHVDKAAGAVVRILPTHHFLSWESHRHLSFFGRVMLGLFCLLGSHGLFHIGVGCRILHYQRLLISDCLNRTVFPKSFFIIGKSIRVELFVRPCQKKKIYSYVPYQTML